MAGSIFNHQNINGQFEYHITPDHFEFQTKELDIFPRLDRKLAIQKQLPQLNILSNLTNLNLNINGGKLLHGKNLSLAVYKLSFLSKKV